MKANKRTLQFAKYERLRGQGVRKHAATKQAGGGRYTDFQAAYKKWSRGRADIQVVKLIKPRKVSITEKIRKIQLATKRKRKIQHKKVNFTIRWKRIREIATNPKGRVKIYAQMRKLYRKNKLKKLKELEESITMRGIKGKGGQT